MTTKKAPEAPIIDPEITTGEQQSDQDPWAIIADLEHANQQLTEDLDILRMEQESEEMQDGHFDQLPEAGGIAWTELYGTKDGHDVKINVTSRGFTSIAALEGLLGCIATASQKYKLKPYRGSAKSAPNSQPAAPTTSAAAPHPVNAPSPAATGSHDTTSEFVLNIVRFETQPAPGGKTKCSFYEADRKYPDLYASNTPEHLAEQMSIPGVVDWTPAHFQIAEIYEMDFQIVYKLSPKLNTKGNPYKDIVRFVYPQ